MHVLTRVVLRDATAVSGRVPRLWRCCPGGRPGSLPQALGSPNLPPLPRGPWGAALTQPCPSPVWW